MCIIEQFPILTDLGKALMKAIELEEELDKIRFIAFSKKEEMLKSGTIHILKVDVVPEKDSPVVEIVCIN